MELRITAFLLFILSGVSKAQFSDSVQYYANLSSSGTFNRTNTQRNYLLNNSVKLSARKKSISYNLLNKWLYGRQDGILTNNDYSSVLDLNLYKTLSRFNYWGLFSFTSAYSLKINSQLQAGAGAAYNIIDRKRVVLNISDGFLYEYSNIVATDSSQELYSTIRNSFRVKFSGSVKNLLKFTAIGFYQPSLLERDDYIIKYEANLALRLRRWISITAALSYNKMNRTRAENLFLTYGLIFERYF